MFENILSPISSKEDLENKLLNKSEALIKSNLKFHEILCPKTGQELNSSDCSNCSHKEEYSRTHPLGFKLSTVICVWEPNGE